MGQRLGQNITGGVISAGVVPVQTVILVSRGLVTDFSFRACRKTKARPTGALAPGVDLRSVGAFGAGVANQGFDFGTDLVFRIEGVLFAAGFCVITYSLSTEW